MSRISGFWARVQQSSWLSSELRCLQLMQTAIIENNRTLLAQVAEGARQHNISLISGIRSPLREVPLPMLTILFESGMQLTIQQLEDILHPRIAPIGLGDLTFTNDAKPYLETILRNCPNPSEFQIEDYLLPMNPYPQAEREQMNRTIPAGMLVRAGVRLRYNVNQINEAYEFAKSMRAALDLPSVDARDPNVIRNQLNTLQNDAVFQSNQLIRARYLSAASFSADQLIGTDVLRNILDNDIVNLKNLKDRIFPRLLRMQKQIQEIEEFEGQRLSYCSARELQKKLREVRAHKCYLAEQALSASVVGGDYLRDYKNLPHELASYFVN